MKAFNQQTYWITRVLQRRFETRRPELRLTSWTAGRDSAAGCRSRLLVFYRGASCLLTRLYQVVYYISATDRMEPLGWLVIKFPQLCKLIRWGWHLCHHHHHHHHHRRVWRKTAKRRAVELSDERCITLKQRGYNVTFRLITRSLIGLYSTLLSVYNYYQLAGLLRTKTPKGRGYANCSSSYNNN